MVIHTGICMVICIMYLDKYSILLIYDAPMFMANICMHEVLSIFSQ